MSRSPRARQGSQALSEYQTAWQATTRLLRAGHSFSGNERNCVFLNCREQRFANTSAVTGLDFADDGRAMAVGDWDHDGDLDVWLANRTGPRLRLMRNETISDQTSVRAAFLALRLRGTTSNRDGIGARVEVVPAETIAEVRPLVQTVCAGDAYLSQSSKWLHFGLGRQSEVESVVVRWPNGEIESFSGAQPNGRYRLVEGTGRAVVEPSRRPMTPLKSAEQVGRATKMPQRVFFSNRLPAPVLRYQPLESSGLKTVGVSGKPTLVTLVASWCPTCAVEMKAFQADYKQFQNAGLKVVILCVDGLDQDQRGQPDDARQFMRDLDASFSTGLATRQLLEKLDFITGLTLNNAPEMAVPTSYLLDDVGAVAAIYRGPLNVRALLSDVGNLQLPLEERRNLVTRFKGRWNLPPRRLSIGAVAGQFRQQGYEEDYVRYLRMESERIERVRKSGPSTEDQQRLDKQYAAVQFNLGLSALSSGDSQAALRYFQAAVMADPEHAQALTNLGALLARNNQLDEAIRLLQRAVDAAPDSPTARLNLAMALASSNRFRLAITHYRAVLALAPATSGVHAKLARALLEVGELVEAVEHLEASVRTLHDFPSALSLCWLLATAPEEAIRDAERAVQIAQQLNKARRGNPLVLDALATALAAQGDFAGAQQTVKQAISQLGDKQPALKKKMLERLQSYVAGQPYRDADGKYP